MAKFQFTLEIRAGYPHDPPTVTCDTLVFHPGIEFYGWLSLPCTWEWVPAMGIHTIITAIIAMFEETPPKHAANNEVYQLVQSDYDEYKRCVYWSLRGGEIRGRKFPYVIEVCLIVSTVLRFNWLGTSLGYYLYLALSWQE
jgi:ubiquitin-protein ligase